MRFLFLLLPILFCIAGGEEKAISQAKFFRMLKIKPTETEAVPFGGLKTVVLAHRALLEKKKKLEFSDQGIRNLRPFSFLHELQWLRLSQNPVSDLSPLAGLKNLQVLSLYGLPKHKNATSRISDLTPLSGLYNLWSLALDEQSIRELSPLSKLVNLRTLYVTRNEVVNLSELSTLKQLKSLFLSHNQIQDISPVSDLKPRPEKCLEFGYGIKRDFLIA